MVDQPESLPEAQRVFAAQLRDLRAQCGKPTQQELAAAMHCGRTMVSEMLTGRRFPTWKQARALVMACAGSNSKELEERWHGQWLSASRKLDALRYGQTDPEQELADLPAAADAKPGSHDQAAFILEKTKTSLVPATWYQDNPEFYRAAAQHVRRAKAEIRATYIRQHPPTDFTTSASAEYFAAVLAWAEPQDDRQRSVRRIISLPHKDGVPDRTMLTWIRQHRDETQDILNYEANVMPWYTSGDGLNVVTIDEDVAFLAFSGGGRQKLNGFSVENPTFVGYFIRHFDQLWSSLQPLETYLQRIDTGS